MIENPQLGQRVTFTRPLERVVLPDTFRRIEGEPGVSGVWQDHKVWRPNPYDKAAYEGVVTGIRTLSDGIRTMNDEAGISYRATDHYEAVLISVDLRKQPVYARPEYVTPVPDEPDLFAERVVALEKIAAIMGSDEQWADPAAILEDAAQYITAAGMPDPGSSRSVAHYRAEADRLGVS